MTRMNPIAAVLAGNITQSRISSGKELRYPLMAEDDEDEVEAKAEEDDNPDRLRVLTDPDAQKLVGKIFNQYISEDNFAELVMFIKDFDALLFKYRKGKPLTREEIEDIEEDTGGAGALDKPKRAKSEDDLENALPEAGDDNLDPDNADLELEGDTPDEEDEPSIVVATDKPLIHLQGIGKVPAVPAGELKAGDVTLWNQTPQGYTVLKAEVVGRMVKLDMRDNASKKVFHGEYRASKMIGVKAEAESAFTVCNGCTGGTAGLCKANQKCMDKASGGPPAVASPVGLALISAMTRRGS